MIFFGAKLKCLFLKVNSGLMDIFQAVMWIKVNKYRTLVHLNVMNKKNAFTAVRKELRKMG